MKTKSLSKRDLIIAIISYLLSYFGIVDVEGPMNVIGSGLLN